MRLSGIHIPIFVFVPFPVYENLENGKITLKDGDTFTLTTDDIVGNQERVSVTYKNLINNLKVGDHVLINNGLIILEVEKLKAPDAICKVLVGGEVSDKKEHEFPEQGHGSCIFYPTPRLRQEPYRWHPVLSAFLLPE